MKSIIFVLIMLLLRLIAPAPVEKSRNYYAGQGSLSLVRNLEEITVSTLSTVSTGNQTGGEILSTESSNYKEALLDFEDWMTDPRKFFTTNNLSNNH